MGKIYKITYQGKEFCGESVEEAVQKAKAYQDALVSNIAETCFDTDSPLATYRYDGEYDSIEIRFQRKPSENALKTLSSNGWKWHRVKKCWYSNRNPINIKFAEKICVASKEDREQIRQNMILSLLTHPRWNKEYLDYSLEELKKLPDRFERELARARIEYDFLCHHGIIVPENCTTEYLNLLGDKCTKFTSQCWALERTVENEAKQLFEIAYLHQLDLYKFETVSKEIEKAKAEREKRKHLQRTLKEGEVLCPICYTAFSSADETCPECKRTEGLQPILDSLSLKKNSFWDALQVSGGNLQPLDIARRLNISSPLGAMRSDNDCITPELNPKFEKLAWDQIKNMPTPDINFDMSRQEFVWTLSILCCQNKEWKQLCRDYCLQHSECPGPT